MDRPVNWKNQHAKIGFFRRVWNSIVYGLKVLGFYTAIAVFLVFVGYVGSFFFPKIKEVEAIKVVESKAPIMDRIAGCESQGNAKLKGTQHDKNGQVLMRSNTNKTVDVGKFQINSIWFSKATELGYDLTTEQGNEGFANWLYKNKGTGDWMSSFNCWK